MTLVEYVPIGRQAVGRVRNCIVIQPTEPEVGGWGRPSNTILIALQAISNRCRSLPYGHHYVLILILRNQTSLP